jgi:hypothetical protein
VEKEKRIKDLKKQLDDLRASRFEIDNRIYAVRKALAEELCPFSPGDIIEYPHGKGFRRAEVVGAAVPRYQGLEGYEVSVTPLLAKGGKGTDVVLETYRLYGARKVQE